MFPDLFFKQMPARPIPALSVIIMTYNEEKNLPRCLKSIQGIGEELFILDSFSTDNTLAIASRFGARLEQHTFDSYVEQKKRLIQKASYDWVFCIDADEYLSEQLRKSILKVKAKSTYDGYCCNRRSSIGDRWINHGSWYPDRKLRLFDRRKVQVTGQDPHDVTSPVEGARISFIKGDLLHHADDNFESRIQKNDKHSTRAAEALYANGVKPNFMRLWVKPAARFITSYFIRLGFLDGYYGWFVARSEAGYVRMREQKLKRLLLGSKGPKN